MSLCSHAPRAPLYICTATLENCLNRPYVNTNRENGLEYTVLPLSLIVTSVYIYFFLPGKVLDATGKYMFVFIIAGIEVVISAFVLGLGNACCIKKKPEQLHMTEDATEREVLNKPQNKTPGDCKVDSIEVEQFLKAEPEKNGEVATNPETCV